MFHKRWAKRIVASCFPLTLLNPQVPAEYRLHLRLHVIASTEWEHRKYVLFLGKPADCSHFPDESQEKENFPIGNIPDIRYNPRRRGLSRLRSQFMEE